MDPSALLEILRAKVSQTKEEKAELQNGLFLLEDELSSAFAKLPKGFKGSRAEYDGIDEKLAKLDYEHTTKVGLSNAQEREMLREMGKVKLRKKELAAFIGVEKELQGARAKRDDKRKALNGCESVLGELVGALRKLELSVKLGCKPADLAEETVVVPEASRGRLFGGKGGSNLHGIEIDCDVAIEVDRRAGRVKVAGLPVGLGKAVQRLDKLIAMVVVEVPLSDAVAVLLSARRAALATKLQKDHDVKVDLGLMGGATTGGKGGGAPASSFQQQQQQQQRAKGESTPSLKQATVTGLPTDVDACVATLKALKAVTKTVKVPQSARAAVIGAKGSSVQGLEREHGVVVDGGGGSSRATAAGGGGAGSGGEGDAESLSVTGGAEGVAACVRAITKLVESNEPDTSDVFLRFPSSVATVDSAAAASASAEEGEDDAHKGRAVLVQGGSGEAGVSAFLESILLASKGERLRAVQRQSKGATLTLERGIKSAAALASSKNKPPSTAAAATTTTTASKGAPLGKVVVSGTVLQVSKAVELLELLFVSVAEASSGVALGTANECASSSTSASSSLSSSIAGGAGDGAAAGHQVADDGAALAVLLRNGGAKIKALREAHPKAFIEIDTGGNGGNGTNNTKNSSGNSNVHQGGRPVARVYCPDQRKRHKAVKALARVCASTQVMVYELNSTSLARQLWGQPGRELRKNILALKSNTNLPVRNTSKPPLAAAAAASKMLKKKKKEKTAVKEKSKGSKKDSNQPASANNNNNNGASAGGWDSAPVSSAVGVAIGWGADAQSEEVHFGGGWDDAPTSVVEGEGGGSSIKFGGFDDEDDDEAEGSPDDDGDEEEEEESEEEEEEEEEEEAEEDDNVAIVLEKGLQSQQPMWQQKRDEERAAKAAKAAAGSSVTGSATVAGGKTSTTTNANATTQSGATSSAASGASPSSSSSSSSSLPTKVLVKGSRSQVSSAKSLLDAFTQGHVSIEVELECAEDERALLFDDPIFLVGSAGGGGGAPSCPLRRIQQQCQVDLVLERGKEGGQGAGAGGSGAAAAAAAAAASAAGGKEGSVGAYYKAKKLEAKLRKANAPVGEKGRSSASGVSAAATATGANGKEAAVYECRVVIEGQRSQVLQAEKLIRFELDGAPFGGSGTGKGARVGVVSLDHVSNPGAAIGLLIGKKGANLRRLEEKHRGLVKVEVVEARNLVRVRGIPTEVAMAKWAAAAKAKAEAAKKKQQKLQLQLQLQQQQQKAKAKAGKNAAEGKEETEEEQEGKKEQEPEVKEAKKEENKVTAAVAATAVENEEDGGVKRGGEKEEEAAVLLAVADVLSDLRATIHNDFASSATLLLGPLKDMHCLTSSSSFAAHSSSSSSSKKKKAVVEALEAVALESGLDSFEFFGGDDAEEKEEAEGVVVLQGKGEAVTAAKATLADLWGLSTIGKGTSGGSNNTSSRAKVVLELDPMQAKQVVARGSGGGGGGSNNKGRGGGRGRSGGVGRSSFETTLQAIAKEASILAAATATTATPVGGGGAVSASGGGTSSGGAGWGDGPAVIAAAAGWGCDDDDEEEQQQQQQQQPAPSSSTATAARFPVAMDLSDGGGSGGAAFLTVEGHPLAVRFARSKVFEALSKNFPGLFLSVPLPSTWLSSSSSSSTDSTSNPATTATTGDVNGNGCCFSFTDLQALVGRSALKAVTEAASSSSSSATTAPRLVLNPWDSTVLVMASEAPVAAKAKQALEAHWQKWLQRRAVVSLRPRHYLKEGASGNGDDDDDGGDDGGDDDDWMVGYVIGAKGAGIKSLLKKFGPQQQKQQPASKKSDALPKKEGQKGSGSGGGVGFGSGLQDVEVDKVSLRVVLLGHPSAVTAAATSLRQDLGKQARARVANKVAVAQVSLGNDKLAAQLVPLVVGKKGIEVRRIQTEASAAAKAVGATTMLSIDVVRSQTLNAFMNSRQAASGGRGGGYGGSGGEGSDGNSFEQNRVRPGDWACPSCKAHNFASKAECFKCQQAKPDSPSPPPVPKQQQQQKQQQPRKNKEKQAADKDDGAAAAAAADEATTDAIPDGEGGESKVVIRGAVKAVEVAQAMVLEIVQKQTAVFEAKERAIAKAKEQKLQRQQEGTDDPSSSNGKGVGKDGGVAIREGKGTHESDDTTGGRFVVGHHSNPGSTGWSQERLLRTFGVPLPPPPQPSRPVQEQQQQKQQKQEEDDRYANTVSVIEEGLLRGVDQDEVEQEEQEEQEDNEGEDEQGVDDMLEPPGFTFDDDDEDNDDHGDDDAFASSGGASGGMSSSPSSSSSSSSTMTAQQALEEYQKILQDAAAAATTTDGKEVADSNHDDRRKEFFSKESGGSEGNEWGLSFGSVSMDNTDAPPVLPSSTPPSSVLPPQVAIPTPLSASAKAGAVAAGTPCTPPGIPLFTAAATAAASTTPPTATAEGGAAGVSPQHQAATAATNEGMLMSGDSSEDGDGEADGDKGYDKGGNDEGKDDDDDDKNGVGAFDDDKVVVVVGNEDDDDDADDGVVVDNNDYEDDEEQGEDSEGASVVAVAAKKKRKKKKSKKGKGGGAVQQPEPVQGEAKGEGLVASFFGIFGFSSSN